MNSTDSSLSRLKKTAPVLTAIAAMVTLASCAHLPGSLTREASKPAEPQAVAQVPEQAKKPPETPEPKPLYEWNGDGRQVSHIEIDVDTQQARFFDGADQIGWTTVASGLKSHPTPTGSFDVLERVSDKRSNLYGKIYNSRGKLVKSDAKKGRDPIPAGGRFVGAKMPYFLRLTYDGIGMHAGRIPVPGFPASHGCIRMPKQMAPILFDHVSAGTAVTIVGNGPDYGNYAERQRIARAQRAAERPPEIQTAAVAEPTPPSAPALYRPKQVSIDALAPMPTTEVMRQSGDIAATAAEENALASTPALYRPPETSALAPQTDTEIAPPSVGQDGQ